MTFQRSIVLFHHAIKSDKTRESYDAELEKFKKYFLIKGFDSLSTIEPKQLQVMLEDYLFYLKRKVSPNSIRIPFNALKLFFSMNDITLNWPKIFKMFPQQVKEVGEKPYTTDDIRKMLAITVNPKYKALIHVLACSGVRIGIIEELKKKHLQDMDLGCKSVQVYADSKDEYFTFLTHEAVQALEKYFDFRRKEGEKLSPDSPVFPDRTNKKFMSARSGSVIMCRISSRALIRKKNGKRFEQMSAHAFRKRFDTVLKSNNSVNISIAEKLLGHSLTIRLDNAYFKPTIERLFEEYQKVIPELLVDEKFNLKAQLEVKKTEIKELELKDKRIQELESKMDFLQTFVTELQKDLKPK